ncbi:MAG: hypothetical protein GY838_16940 [bacterium]|nr:hypothetical protein [bacterium]
MTDPLDDERFAWTATKDGRVLLSFEGRQVVTLTGKKAERFRARIEGVDPRRAQLLMAKATGNFKRGG